MLPTLTGEKVVIAGVTGKVAGPVARHLAADNEVWGLARFTDRRLRDDLTAAGVRCVPVDLGTDPLDGVPRNADVVLNFAVTKTGSWDVDLDGNAGGLGRLMLRCTSARAVLHCSSTAVYQCDGHRRFREDDALGDNHRPLPNLATYSIAKIAAEAVARLLCRELGVPTTIARLNVPYGPPGFWPAHHVTALLSGTPIAVHADAPSEYNPIHLDDVVAMVPAMLAAASVPATVVNWAGNDVVSIEEWCTHLGALVGRRPVFAPTVDTIGSVAVDVSRMLHLVGRPAVAWQDGMARMVRELVPGG